MNIDTECKSVTHIGHDQPVVDHIMLKKNMAYKHDIPHKGLYANNQACNIGTFRLQMGSTTDIINVFRIKPFNSKIYWRFFVAYPFIFSLRINFPRSFFMTQESVFFTFNTE